MVEAFDRSKHLPSSSPTLIHELFLTVKLRKPKHINYDGFVKLYAEKDFTCELKFQFYIFWRHRIDESKADLNVFLNPKQIREIQHPSVALQPVLCHFIINKNSIDTKILTLYNVEFCFTNTWIVTVAFLTKNMMTGDMTSTNKSTAIPNACCWLAAYNSFLTISLKNLD